MVDTKQCPRRGSVGAMGGGKHHTDANTDANTDAYPNTYADSNTHSNAGMCEVCCRG